MESLLLLVVSWLLLSSCLYLIGRQLAKRYMASKNLWWGLLLLTFIPFVPFPTWLPYDNAIPEFLLFADIAVPTTSLIYPLAVNAGKVDSLLTFSLVILCCYLIVTAIKLLNLYRQFRGLAKLCSTAEEIHTGQIKARVLPISCSPFIFGFKQPQIYLPANFTQLPHSEQQALYLHEDTHMQSGDHIAVIVWRICSTVFWFNPFVHLMEKSFLRAMELCCDRQTLERYSGNAECYAKALMNSLKRSRDQQLQWVAGFSSATFSADDYRKRFQYILSVSKAPSKTRLFVCFSLLFSTLSMANIQFNSQALKLASDTPLQWAYPLAELKVTSRYGHVSAVRQFKKHGGVDFAAPTGTHVSPVAEGVVVVADMGTLSKNYGKVVLLQHNNGYQSLYAHLEAINVDVGQRVYKGQTIGLVGTTGKTTGPHLHLEILENQERIDPLLLLDSD